MPIDQTNFARLKTFAGIPIQLTGETTDSATQQIELTPLQWGRTARFLREDAAFQFDWLRCLTAVDYPANGLLAVYYHLWSFQHRHDLEVKVTVSRDDARVPSVARIWPTADWHEREAFDLFGIEFDGHPDLRRILMSDDWEGFPLLKDYVFPREYHGIPGSVELDWQQQRG